MAFPTTGVIDDFTRADTGPPPSANWSANPDGAVSPQFKVVSNQMVPNAANPWMTWNVADYGPDCEARIDLATLPNATEVIELELRLVSVGTSGIDGYLADVRPSDGRVRIFKLTNDTGSVLTTVTTAAWNAGDGFGFEVTGTATTTLTVYRRVSGTWSSYASTTDSSSPFTAAGRIGVFASDVDGAYDNFGGGTVVVAGAATHRRRRSLTGVGR